MAKTTRKSLISPLYKATRYFLTESKQMKKTTRKSHKPVKKTRVVKSSQVKPAKRTIRSYNAKHLSAAHAFIKRAGSVQNALKCVKDLMELQVSK